MNAPSQKPLKASRDLAKGGFHGLVGTSVSLVSIFLIQVFIGRCLGVEKYGLYTLGFIIIRLIGNISNLGLRNGVVRYVTIHRGEGSEAKIKGVFFSSLLLPFLICCIFILIIFLFGEALCVLLFKSGDLVPVLRIFSISLPFFIITTNSAAFLQAFRRIDYQLVVSHVFRPLVYLSILSVLFFTGFYLTRVSLGYTLSYVLSSALGLYLVKRIFKDLFSPEVKPTFLWRKLLRFSLPTFFAGLSYVLVTRTDRLMIGYFLEPKDVGIYNAAFQISMQMSIFLAAIVYIFTPMISELHSRNRQQELNALFKQATRWIATFTLPLFLIIFLFKGELLSLFGEAFTAGSTVLVIMLMASIVNTSTGPVGVTLQMTGKQDIDLTNNVVLFILNVALNLILIPRFGITGAVIATATSFSLIHIARLVEVYFLLKLSPYDRKIIKPVVSFLVGFAGILFIESQFELGIGNKILYGGGVLVLYFLLLYLLKIEKEDYEILNHIVRKIRNV